MSRFLIAVVWSCLAALVTAQGPLGEDLQRAESGFTPLTNTTPSEVDELTAKAGEYLRAGHQQEAIALLDKAAGVAFKSGAKGRTFELSLTAAEIQRNAGQLEKAAKRFCEAALANPNDPRAAIAHQTGIQAYAATLQRATPEQLDQYDQMLAEHTRQWPEAKTAETIRWQRIELLARREQWEELLEEVRGIAKGDPRFKRSRELVVAAHAGLVAHTPSPERFAAARKELEPLFLYNPTPWPESWTPLQRDAAYTLARAAAGQGAEDLEYARTLLRVSLRNRPAPSEAWQRRAAALLVVVLLNAGEAQEAEKWLAVAHRGPNQERQQLFAATQRRLNNFAGGTSPPAEADRLELSIATLASNQAPRTRQDAAALAEVGRDEEALQLYQQLATERPNDRDVQIAYARLLSQGETTDEQQRAELLWRTIESRSERSGKVWWEARLARLRLLVDLGKKEEASKLLAMTRLLAADRSDEVSTALKKLAQAIE